MKYTCYECNYATDDKSKMKSHKNTQRHVTKITQCKELFAYNGKCPDCDYYHENIYVLKHHMRSHKNLFQCYLCDESFLTKQLLGFHLEHISHLDNLKGKLKN